MIRLVMSVTGLGVLAVLAAAVAHDPRAWLALLHLADGLARHWAGWLDARLPQAGASR